MVLEAAERKPTTNDLPVNDSNDGRRGKHLRRLKSGQFFPTKIETFLSKYKRLDKGANNVANCSLSPHSTSKDDTLNRPPPHRNISLAGFTCRRTTRSAVRLLCTIACHQQEDSDDASPQTSCQVSSIVACVFTGLSLLVVSIVSVFTDGSRTGLLHVYSLMAHFNQWLSCHCHCIQ